MGEVDEAMEDDGGKKKDNSAASRQNEKLYTADGMLNTKLRCGEKKKRKKAKKASASSDPMDGYNFKTDYFQASMDSEDSQGEDDDDEPVKSEVPISAIQIDE